MGFRVRKKTKDGLNVSWSFSKGLRVSQTMKLSKGVTVNVPIIKGQGRNTTSTLNFGNGITHVHTFNGSDKKRRTKSTASSPSVTSEERHAALGRIAANDLELMQQRTEGNEPATPNFWLGVAIAAVSIASMFAFGFWAGIGVSVALTFLFYIVIYAVEGD